MSALIASHAAALIASGAGKSGKPCDRLTALCWCDSRVISRMTDSVKRAAFREVRGRTIRDILVDLESGIWNLQSDLGIGESCHLKSIAQSENLTGIGGSGVDS